MGKAIDFQYLWIIASHLTVLCHNALSLLHVPTLSSHVTRHVSILCQGLVQMQKDVQRRVNEIKGLTSNDIYTRETIKAGLLNEVNFIGQDDELTKLARLANDTRVLHAR